MLYAASKVRKSSFTIFAGVWFLPSVLKRDEFATINNSRHKSNEFDKSYRSHVTAQLEIDNKSFSTDTAFEWFLIAMPSHMAN